MLRKELPDSHSSLTSERRAETRRSRDFSFGKRVATRVRRLISLLSLSRLLEVRSFLRWGSGRAKTVRLCRVVGFEPVGEVWGGLFVFGGDGFELVLSGQQIRRIENGAEVVGDFFPHVDFGDEGQGVLLEMELATLPGDTGKASGQGGAETCVVVTDDQAQAVETPELETGEELAPMDFSFTEFGADA